MDQQLIEPRAQRAVFEDVIGRLNRQSVDKHFDAYVDVAWDDPAMALDPTDPRLELFRFDPLAHTDWYRGLPADQRAEVGLFRMASLMRTGWGFENLLQRGLLTMAYDMPNGRPEFRYLHHEIIEESHHTMMFQELVNRSGMDVEGMPRWLRILANRVVSAARWRPVLFFLFVLGGEDPVDYVQKRCLRTEVGHPLIQRIMRIHITEEARHVSFARQYLKTNLPQLSRPKRLALSLVAPVPYGIMARMLVWPMPEVAKAYRVPRDDLRRARRAPQSMAMLADSVAKPRRLCRELGLMNVVSRRLWSWMGVGDPPSTSAVGAVADPDDPAAAQAI